MAAGHFSIEKVVLDKFSMDTNPIFMEGLPDLIKVAVAIGK